jgi:Ca-activated chloride channel family protein
MFDPLALEVVLTPRKQVLVDSPRHNLDLLLRLRSHEHEASNQKRTPLAIAIVIDRSGSMAGGKLEQAKRSAVDIINRLHDHDSVSVISYDDSVEVHLELMPVPSARIFIDHHLDQLFARGGTNLHAGWLKGAETLAPRSNGKDLCRVILLSDGQANVGIIRTNLICDQVAELSRAGITTTTVGFGLDFNEELMTAMANAGQGNAWYGERVEDLQDSFDSEMSFLTHLVFKQVEVIAHYSGRGLKIRNEILSSGRNTWRISGLAYGAEKWLAFSIPMQEAIDAQSRTHGRNQGQETIIDFEIVLTDQDNQSVRIHAKLMPLPVVELAQYQAAPEDELVSRRFQEVEMADLQRDARNHVKDRNWAAVERMINDLDRQSVDNPWVQKTIQYLRKLMDERDHMRMEKELMYSLNMMKNRSVALDEGVEYSMNLESMKPAFLRRKTHQGRNQDSQS